MLIKSENRQGIFLNKNYGFFILFTLSRRLFAPTSWIPMSKLFRFSETLGESNAKKWSHIGKLLLVIGVKSPCKKDSFSANLVSVLLSALVERFFVSRMWDFLNQISNIGFSPLKLNLVLQIIYIFTYELNFNIF